MPLKRTILSWPVLLLSGALLWTGCKEKPLPEAPPNPEAPLQQGEEEKTPELRPPGKLSPVKPWSGQPTLRIYYERAPLEQEWIKRWTAASQYRIEQAQLPGAEGRTFPLDGDLYVVSPPLIRKLQGLLEWQAPSSLIPLDQIKPLFTGHSFDPDNRVSLPWRWSPYVFYRKKNAPEQILPAFSFSGWTADEDSCWPEDWPLLWAMKRHLAQGSANAPVNEAEIKAAKALKEQLAAHVLPEEACWKNFMEGKIRNTFALAAWRLKQGQSGDNTVDWAIPAQGTLIQFEHLMMPAQSPYAPAVQELVKMLLSIEGQDDLAAQTGYFPVRAGSGTDPGPAGPRLPGGSWLDNSEFLVLDLAALLAEQPTPTPAVAEPTP